MKRRTGLAVLAAATALLLAAPAGAAKFPKSFLWGTASAGFQSEAGGSPANVDRRSDWYAFTSDPGLIADGVVSGDRIADGPGFLNEWRGDLSRASNELDNNAIRLGIEWSRIFPRSTEGIETGKRVSKRELRELDELASPKAVKLYQRILRSAQGREMKVMLTLNHFTLPVWVHDPIEVREAFAGVGPDDPIPAGLERSGWLDPDTVEEFRKYAAYAAWKFEDHVDLWATLNEPLVLVSQGYVSIPGVTGVKAPAVLNYPAALAAVENLGLANAAAYDAVHDRIRGARVGFVHNLVDWRPADPSSAADARSVENVDQILNRAYLEIAINGWYDLDADGVKDPGEVRRKLRDKADYVGVNHYSPGRVQSLGIPVSSTIPLFDFAPSLTYRGTGNPEGPPCPTTCTDFGWEIDPTAFRNVVELAASYGKPVYVTENGIDDGEDDQRRGYLRSYLAALQRSIASGTDVRGYFYWSLLDNYEWAEGFGARFGLYGYDEQTLEREMQPSAKLYGKIARSGRVPKG